MRILSVCALVFVLLALVFVLLAPLRTGALAGPAEDDLVSRMGNFEQLVQVRLAGIAADARRLIEMADQVIERRSAEVPSSVSAGCAKVAPVPDLDRLLAEADTATRTTVARWKIRQEDYKSRLSKYNALPPSSPGAVDEYYRLNAQYLEVNGLRSKAKSLGAILELLPDIAKTSGALSQADCLTHFSSASTDVDDRFFFDASRELIQRVRRVLDAVLR